MYAALKGVAVGGLSDILTMTSEEEDLWCGYVIASKVTTWLMENRSKALEPFYEITDEGLNSWSTYYERKLSNYSAEYNYDMVDSAGMFGFKYEYEDLGQKGTFTQQDDVQEYVARVYAYEGKESEFLSNYEPESKAYRKFQIMRDLIADFEETFNVH